MLWVFLVSALCLEDPLQQVVQVVRLRFRRGSVGWRSMGASSPIRSALRGRARIMR